MPTYEYACPDCGGFTAMRAMAEYREPHPCPDCGEPAPRAIFTVPGLPILSASARHAHAGNERARHEPRLSSQTEPARGHGAGCACCKPGAPKSRTVTQADGSKSFPTKRPWMISH